MNPSHAPLARARLGARIALAAALALAVPAGAAQVVDVRVGTHPTFTRVVFELDEAAGYRIARAGGDRNPQIVVTLDAAAKSESLRSGGDIDTVRVEGGAPAVAHIALRRPGLRLKEMILSHPPRIVLDVVSPEPAKAPKPRATTPAPAPKPPKAASAKAEAPAKAPQPKPAPPPAPPRAAAPAPAPPPSQAAPPSRAVVEPPAPAPPAPAAGLPAAPEPVPPVPPAPLEPSRSEVEPTAPAKPAPAMRRPSLPPAPGPVAKPGLVERILGEPMWIGGGGALLLLAIAGLVLARRRRALPNDLDVSTLVDESEGEGRIPAGGFAMGGVPAAGTPASDEGGTLSSLFDDASAAPSPDMGTDSDGLDTSAPAAPADAGAPFAQPAQPRTDPSQGEPRMSQDLDLPAARSAGPPPPAAAPGADVARLVQELERRVIALESKLDESNEAREKLERQVAAQSEELRVQRAAIARTQRALRTMSRADEDKATEPALRDGETQTTTRVKV